MHYIIQPVELGEAKGSSGDIKRLVGRIANIETIFPAWSIDEEQWSEPITPDNLVNIVYPANLKVDSSTTFAEYLGLGPKEPAADPKGKNGKAAAKKGAEEVIPKELKEELFDEEGKPLPVVYKATLKDSEQSAGSPEAAEVTEVGGKGRDGLSVGEEDEDDEDRRARYPFLRFDIPRDFKRRYATEQIKVRNEQDRMRRRIEELQQEQQGAGKGGEGVGAELEALEAELQRSLEENDVEAEGPQGGYIDPYMCHAYLLLQQYVPLIVRQAQANMATSPGQAVEEVHEDNDTRKVLDENYLWRAIYPKLPNGKPCYNPSGKYCVKLYLAGKWRKVYVDDSVPLRSDGLPALASSEDRLELWPLILSKALYTVYSACGYEEVLHSHMLVCCELIFILEYYALIIILFAAINILILLID